MSDNPTPQDLPAVTQPGTDSLIGASWQEQDSTLRDLWMQNKTPQEIGDALGRSVPAIMTRAARLGLPRRAAPGRKPGAGSTRRLPPLETEITKRDKRRAQAAADRDDASSVEAATQASVRVCLMCLRKFESAGRHNRICAPCKGTAEYIQASALPDVQLPQS